MKKTFQFISTYLLSALIIVSSFGCTVIIHSCNISGMNTILINSTNTDEACDDCCGDESKNNNAAFEKDCCADKAFSSLLVVESNHDIKNVSLEPTLKTIVPFIFYIASAEKPSIKKVFFPAALFHIAAQQPLLQSLCKLQI